MLESSGRPINEVELSLTLIDWGFGLSARCSLKAESYDHADYDSNYE